MALTPYKAAKQVATYASYTPYGRTASFAGRAARAAKMAYDSGVPQAAARKIGKQYRAYRARRGRRTPNTAKVGKSPSQVSDNKLFTTLDENPTNRDSRTLYTHEITDIPKDTGFNDIDNRQREICYLNGVKIAISLKNNSTKPVHWNVALIMNRRNPSSIPAIQEFFRGSGISRGLDFNNGLNSNDFRARFINSDANVVLMHERFTLSTATETSYEAGFKPSFMTFDKYVPIKRMITYDRDTSNANHRIFLVYWCDEFNTATGTLPQSSVIEQCIRMITYFKEPKVTF